MLLKIFLIFNFELLTYSRNLFTICYYFTQLNINCLINHLSFHISYLYLYLLMLDCKARTVEKLAVITVTEESKFSSVQQEIELNG